MIRIIVHFHENVSWNASINNGWDLDDHGEYFRCIYKNPASYTVNYSSGILRKDS